MSKIAATVIALIGIGLSPLVSGKGDDPNPGTGAGSTAEVRTLSESIPAGGTVQVKYLLTQPRPITSGGYRFATHGFAVDGISITSPLGDTAGVGVTSNGTLKLTVISPKSDYGTNLDYPFMTVTMDIPPSTPAASTFPLNIAYATVQTPSGPLTFTDPKPGTLTIAGSVSVRGIFPGGGTYPAGTVISVKGNGFQPGTKITSKMKMLNVVYVSATEMNFTLADTETLDTQPIQVSNPDRSQVVFYSYLRGTPVSVPSRPVLKSTDPVFQAHTHLTATVSGAKCAASHYLALALQNPNPYQVSIGFTKQSTGAFSSLLLPPLGRVMDDVAVLIGGPALTRSDTLQITATSPVQLLGLCADDVQFTVVPFLPTF